MITRILAAAAVALDALTAGAAPASALCHYVYEPARGHVCTP